MNEQYEKSLSKLELDKVLSLLADHASSQEAKDRCMAIRPSADADEIRHLLEETSAACKCITIKGSPSFGGLYDVGASLDRAYRGGCLSPEELLRIAGVLRAARQAKSYAEGEGAQEASVLDLYFQQITSNKYLEERIFNSILSKDEIADAASSELASIRRKIRQQSAKIRESLQKIITSPSYAKILQEPIVTIRSDRFVVPVKAECKGQLPGLVHDVASSGSTYFIEPMSAVNGNNELRELFMAERKEIERILEDSDEPVTFTLGDKHILFSIGDALLVSRVLEGEFIDWRRVVPTNCGTVLTANVAELTSSIERVSLIISEKVKSPVRCVFGDNMADFRTANTIGSAHDTCSIAGNGGELEIGFNSRYLLDALRVIPSEEVTLELQNGLSPIVFTPCDKKYDFAYMVLPVRLRSNS